MALRIRHRIFPWAPRARQGRRCLASQALLLASQALFLASPPAPYRPALSASWLLRLSSAWNWPQVSVAASALFPCPPGLPPAPISSPRPSPRLPQASHWMSLLQGSLSNSSSRLGHLVIAPKHPGFPPAASTTCGIRDSVSVPCCLRSHVPAKTALVPSTVAMMVPALASAPGTFSELCKSCISWSRSHRAGS